MGAHPQAGKLKLTAHLPRAPGVYVFRDARGRPLYVGKAANLRARVRSYFSSDDRRKIGPLLRETARARPHRVPPRARGRGGRAPAHPQRWRPATTGRAAAPAATFLKLTLAEPFPTAVGGPDAADDGALYLGPLPSPRMARLAAEAIESVVPLRRCSARLRPSRRARPVRAAPCAAAQLGVSVCPCAGHITAADYQPIVDPAVEALTDDPSSSSARSGAGSTALARAERFEEAADVRDRAEALATRCAASGGWSSWRRAAGSCSRCRGEASSSTAAC